MAKSPPVEATAAFSTPEQPSETTPHPYEFHVSGPRNLSAPNWRDLIRSSWFVFSFSSLDLCFGGFLLYLGFGYMYSFLFEIAKWRTRFQFVSWKVAIDRETFLAIRSNGSWSGSLSKVLTRYTYRNTDDVKGKSRFYLFKCFVWRQISEFVRPKQNSNFVALLSFTGKYFNRAVFTSCSALIVQHCFWF